MDEDVLSLRCTACLTNWPAVEEFIDECPECEEPTRPSWVEEPIAIAEANRRLNRVLFERLYGPAEVN